ncbi:MAG: hypothetical protein N2A99_03170 [Carnobacterium alterfunditum]
MNFYRTTNLEEALDISKISFEKYSDAMKIFLGKMETYQSTTIKMPVDISRKQEVE